MEGAGEDLQKLMWVDDLLLWLFTAAAADSAIVVANSASISTFTTVVIVVALNCCDISYPSGPKTNRCWQRFTWSQSFWNRWRYPFFVGWGIYFARMGHASFCLTFLKLLAFSSWHLYFNCKIPMFSLSLESRYTDFLKNSSTNDFMKCLFFRNHTPDLSSV